jgi:hypothetical protein
VITEFEKIKNICRPLRQPYVFMLLRYNKMFRILAILLFSFELLAPAVLIGTPESNLTFEQGELNINQHHQSLDFITHLICEEASSEEREHKDSCFISVSFIEVFNELEKFRSIQISSLLPKDRFNSQPSLFTLHRVLLI